jgi:putative spermidine/putrescine transport system permease protein
MTTVALPAPPRDTVQARYRWLGTALAALTYIFLVLPSLVVIPISFGGRSSFGFPPQTLSLDLYRDFFTTATWQGPLLQSLKIALATTVTTIIVAVPASYALVRYSFIGKRLLTMLIMSAVFVPVIVIALGLYLYFAKIGLSGSNLALVLGHTVYVTPFVILTISAGVRQLDPTLEFAATMMGAKRTTLFARVVLPQLRPSILAGALFAFLISFDEVVIAWFLVSATTTTLPVRMYSSIQWDISPVIAAISVLLTVLSFVVCLVAVALQPSSTRDPQIIQ